MQRKNITENKDGDSEVLDLIIALYSHPNCPEYLREDIWDCLNNNTSVDGNDPDQIKQFWKYRHSDETGKSNFNTEIEFLERIENQRRRSK